MKRQPIMLKAILNIVAVGLATYGGAIGTPTSVTAQPIEAPTAGPTIRNITTNLADYPNGQAPQYEKFEVTFEVDTVAENLQLPYGPAPPPGIDPEIGVTVNALFTPDNWQTVYTQPAFYYQEFEDQVKSGKEWFYPTGSFSWKVRFAPNQVGEWQYKLFVQDASGTAETQPQSFTVASSNNNGFIRVSQQDPRYFEYEDGTYFPGLGYNMNYNHVNWVNPVLDNQDNFQKMSQNGIQLIRIWLSQWGIFTSAWNPWYSMHHHDTYIPRTGIMAFEATPTDPGSIKMKISADHTWFDSCMFLGFGKPAPVVKRNTNYHIKIKYRTYDVTGPRDPTYPDYGFVAKVGGWYDNCNDAGTGTPVTPYSGNTPDWAYLEGNWNSGSNDFMPFFYLAMENANTGDAYVDYVWIQEDLGNGQYGPNIVSKPWMSHHLYMDQRNSYSFDELLDLARQNSIYLRPVILEKNEDILNVIGYDGQFTSFSNDNFYGNYRTVTAVRWLQQAWWRYLQARWGYSTNIHSWELLNEGDPWNGLHYTLADEFGKYMREFKPNDHLGSTSNWHSFPKDNFWANPEYPHVDFADIHQYIGEGDPNFYDTALATQTLSMQYGAKTPGGAGKPVIRGETGFVTSGSGPPSDEILQDTDGVWLHNFIWGGINAGGLIESYWYENVHIHGQDFDHRHHYGAYYNFIKDIPLNSGNYQDAEALVSNEDLRAWGQKDLLNGRAHLWIQNKGHTWKNMVDGVSIPEVSGTVEVSGFQPGECYAVEWWDTYQSDKAQQIMRTDTSVARADGSISISVDNLTTDVAIRIIAALEGDVNCDCRVDIVDIMLVASRWNTRLGDPGYDARYDLNQSGNIDIQDIMLVAARWGNAC